MKIFYKTVVILVLMISNQTFAQQYKFGKVSKEELLEKSYPSDSSANAAVLYESKEIWFEYNQQNGFQLITEVFKRIKLYDKNGFDYASEEFFLYKQGGDKEGVGNLKGMTYSLVGDKIVKTKLQKEGIFKNEYSKNNDQLKFTLPSLQEGSVIEFKYRITSPFVFNLDRVYLQQTIPIKNLDIAIKMPEYFNFKKVTTGYLPINIKESSAQDQISITSKTTNSSVGFSGRGTKFSNSIVDYRIIINKINSKNIPAFIREPYSGNIENYISAIDYELSSISFPNQPIEHRSTTWEDVAKTIYDDSRFGDELKKNNYYKEEVDQLITGVTNSKEKMLLIYNFARKKMTWNEKRRVFTEQGVKKAYKENTGNTSEINLILTSMLTYAGIDANPVIGSTSDRAISLFPTIDGFNYVITRVKLSDGEIIYLDATDKYGMPNVLPDRIIRGMGRVIAKNGTSQMVDFRPVKPSLNFYRMQCEIDEEGMTKGVFGITYKDHMAHDFRVNNSIKNEESKIKRFEKKYGITELEEYSVKGVKEYGKGVNEKLNFTINDQIEVIDDEIFFSPLLFLRDKENVFKSEDRKYPIDFGYGFSNKYMINIKIPEGYEVAEFPKESTLKLPNNMGAFSFVSNVSNGVIQVIVNETMETAVISADYYPAVKEFYNQVIQKENEQVVLKKI